jgi:hypothetical protein
MVHSENALGAPERPYVEDHIDNQEISEEDRQKAADAMNEANARYHNNTGTMPLQTLPHPSASGTMVRPMTAETPQENAVRPDRPLGQQLPDAMPSAASTSPNQEREKQEAVRQAQQTTRQRPTPPAPQRQTPRDEEE